MAKHFYVFMHLQNNFLRKLYFSGELLAHSHAVIFGGWNKFGNSFVGGFFQLASGRERERERENSFRLSIFSYFIRIHITYNVYRGTFHINLHFLP